MPSIKKQRNKSHKNVKINALVILDIDSTLMGSVPSISRSNADDKFMGYDNYKRPFVDLFIKECFDKFKHVAIWTAGSKGWADNFVNNVLYMKNSNFLFIWDQTHCMQIRQSDGSFNYCKPLKIVWKKREIRSLGLGRSNVFLIDDRAYNGIFNRYNQITIPEFDINEKDDVLGQMIIYFRELKWNSDCREAITRIKLYRRILK